MAIPTFLMALSPQDTQKTLNPQVQEFPSPQRTQNILNSQAQEFSNPQQTQSTRNTLGPQARGFPNSQDTQETQSLGNAFIEQHESVIKTQQGYFNSQQPKAPTPLLTSQLSTEENQLIAYQKMQTYQYVSKYGHELSENCKWWLTSKNQPWEHRFGHWDGKTWVEVLRILELEIVGYHSMINSEERAISTALQTAAAKCNDENLWEIFESVRESVYSRQNGYGKVSSLHCLQAKGKYRQIASILERDYDKIADYITFIECRDRRKALERQVKDAIHNVQNLIFGEQGIPRHLREREGEEGEDRVWAPVEVLSKQKRKMLAKEQAKIEQETEDQAMAALSGNRSPPPSVEAWPAQGWRVVGWLVVGPYTSEMVYPAMQDGNDSPPVKVRKLLAQGKRLAGWLVRRSGEWLIEFQSVQHQNEDPLPQVEAPPLQEQRIAGWWVRPDGKEMEFQAIQDRDEEEECQSADEGEILPRARRATI